jgi:hypothetical protein
MSVRDKYSTGLISCFTAVATLLSSHILVPCVQSPKTSHAVAWAVSLRLPTAAARVGPTVYTNGTARQASNGAVKLNVWEYNYNLWNHSNFCIKLDKNWHFLRAFQACLKFRTHQILIKTEMARWQAWIWLLPRDLYFLNFAIAIPTSGELELGTNGLAVCTSICPTSLTCTFNNCEN